MHPPRRCCGGRGDRTLQHGPCSWSTSRQCTPRASRWRPPLGRATCGGARPYAQQGTACRGPLPTCPCPEVGTMPIYGYTAACRRRAGRGPERNGEEDQPRGERGRSIALWWLVLYPHFRATIQTPSRSWIGG